MNLQRNYSSPNCTLFLQGFSDDSSNSAEGLPILSVLISATCQIVGCETKLTGGKDFFVNLAKAVSSYAQGFLSGIGHPQESQGESDLVYLEPLTEKNRHLLVWQPNKDNEENKVELELTTVQLFDLVEAIDQFFADSRTLPDLNLDLHPVSRRYRQAEETIVQQSTPAALGLAGFALATVILFLIPIPSEIKDPRLEDERIKENNSTETIPENQLPFQNPPPLP